MSNPYASPQFASNVNAEPEQRERLRRIAKFQRWVLYALLASILSYIVFFMAAAARHETIFSLSGYVFVLSAIFSVVAIFLLARVLYSTAVGVLCAILMFIPCVSLVTLAIVNGKATAHLKAHGVKVGLMGANPETI